MQCNKTVLQGNFTGNKPMCNTTQCNTTVQREDFREIPQKTVAKQCNTMQCNTTVIQGNFSRNESKSNPMQCNTTVQQQHFRDKNWRNKCNTMQHNSATCKFY